MYLKSIEMQGFKSFANKIVLEFHDGITAIVGPNGSGKSNVADAVRWVLGEQSAKQLRGGVMQDIIFSGTELRKPLSYAYVAITLDNSDHALKVDFQEVTITRRLYRSGESEYLLNGSAVKLRDIRELFYDTGIGKEGYSIIGQGQIDQILNGKPEDRRELFDEAAGIVKFKRRKAQTLKKLEQEESNLIRVTDILSELTKQLGPLSRQSETARVYLAQKEEQKQLEANFFLVEEERTARELKLIEEHTSITESQLAETRDAFDRTHEEYEQIEQELSQLDEKIQELRELVSRKKILISDSTGEIRLLAEQIQTLTGTAELSGSRIQTILQEQENRASQLKNFSAELDSIREILWQGEQLESEKEQFLDESREQIRRAEQEMDDCKTGLLGLLHRRGSIRGQLQRCDATLEQIQIRRADLTQKALQFKTEEMQRKKHLDELQHDFHTISDQTASYHDEIKALDADISECTDQLNQLAVEHENAQSNYHRNASRLESLRNVTENYDGYNNSIRKVMEQKRSNAGIHGVVADLIQAEEKYETAIETALGGSIQNIVTDNDTTAKYLIEYLKRGRFGRATFLPLTSISGKKQAFARELMAEPGVIGVAAELVTYEKQYLALIYNLLGKTLVIDHIDHAIAIGRKYRHSIRMVTLEGELLSPGGSMTGGSFKNNNNLLGRRREIEELEKQVRRDSMNLAALNERQEETRKARNELRNRRNEINNQLQRGLLALNTAKLKYDNAVREARQLEEDYSRIQIDTADLERQIRELQDEKEQIELEMQESVDTESAENKNIDEMREYLDTLRRQESSISAELEQARIRKAGLVTQVSFQKENIARIKEEQQALSAEQEQLQNLIEEGSEQTRIKQAHRQDLEHQIAEAEAAVQEAETKIQSLQSLREAKNQTHHQFFEKRDALSGQISLLDKELYRLNSQKEKVEGQRDEQLNYLWNEYEITPGLARKMRMDEVPERNELKRKIAEIKDRIRRLGPVNVNAIEEYREVKERHEFMSNQHDDLVKAAEQLRSIIAELDNGMRKQFHEKFGEIRTEFDKVFRQLFGGGRGTLELEEHTDVLEAGIRIIASPPGKKLQNMMQLSGGEKALTAIALLFAIQNLKPSPFCLLDEIEAALDDSNVVRFAGYLHRLSKNTQFIVITHRRGTMNAADRLYGITMQEKGISTLVSVNLIENALK